jgi:hypothetical protein
MRYSGFTGDESSLYEMNRYTGRLVKMGHHV